MHSTLAAAEDFFYPATLGSQRKSLLLYSVAVLGLTTLIVACFPLLHITNNWAANTLMFVPGLLALVFRLRRREGLQSSGWRTGPFVYWVWALLLPTIVILIVLPLSLRLGYAALAPATSSIGRLLPHPVKIIENMLIYIAISVPFALGEEFGWRGYAQPRFIREFGLLKGLLLLGLLWGFWHSPIYYVIHIYPDHPFLGPFIMTPVDNILAVVPLAWLYLRSRSIWVVTLIHAFADVLWGFAGLLFPPSNDIAYWAILQAVQLIISLILFLDLRRFTTKLDHREAAVTVQQVPLNPLP